MKDEPVNFIKELKRDWKERTTLIARISASPRYIRAVDADDHSVRFFFFF